MAVETYRWQQKLLALAEAASIAALLERDSVVSTERRRVPFLNHRVNFEKGSDFGGGGGGGGAVQTYRTERTDSSPVA